MDIYYFSGSNIIRTETLCEVELDDPKCVGGRIFPDLTVTKNLSDKLVQTELTTITPKENYLRFKKEIETDDEKLVRNLSDCVRIYNEVSRC